MREELSGPVGLPVTRVFTLGQILISPNPEGGFRLCHRDDAQRWEKLPVTHEPEKALEIARTDDSGNYRPLKTAPNLRRGWRMEIGTSAALKCALDYFYPGRLAAVGAYHNDRLRPTALRDTLGRQSGMYRVAATISDEQLNDLVGNFCRSDTGCLRTILWKRDATGAVPSSKLPLQKFDPEYDQVLATGRKAKFSDNVPLLCQEACNLLVAECRKIVKDAL
jgi:sirohydrochlorin cobaltochelatase